MLKQDQRERIVAMRRDGMTVARIATAMKCSQWTVKQSCSQAGLCRRQQLDPGRLAQLWNGPLTVLAISDAMECSVTTVTREARRLGLKSRRLSNEPGDDSAPSEADAELSADSLALSPYVQARIKELRLGMPA